MLLVGVVASVDYVQIYPSPLFDRLVRLDAFSWPEELLLLSNLSLSFSQEDKLYLVKSKIEVFKKHSLFFLKEFFKGRLPHVTYMSLLKWIKAPMIFYVSQYY